jgi:ribosome-associated protein
MDIDKILKELHFKAVRSSGPGGQHVNKTATKIELIFPLLSSEGLTESEKITLQKRLASRLLSDGSIMLQCGETRSQLRNKKLVIDRLISLLEENSKVKKVRKKTTPSKSVIEKRLQIKKITGQKKATRRPPDID